MSANDSSVLREGKPLRVVLAAKLLLAAAILLLVTTGVALWFIVRTPTHPEFGVVYYSEMREAFVEPEWWRNTEDRIRLLLGMDPKLRYGEHGLPIGPSLLGWSLHKNVSPRSGYVYFQDVRPRHGNVPLWEIAKSGKVHFEDVTRSDLTNAFVGAFDPRGTNLFGAAYDGRTLLIEEGDVLLARLLSPQSVVYAVHFAKQRGSDSGGSMLVRYVIATNAPQGTP